MNSAAIYAGSFDPMTLGHLDVAERAVRIFPRIVIAVAEASHKKLHFNVQQRTAIVREAVTHLPGIEVESFGGLLVEYARHKNIHVIIRGLRAFSDFEFEFQMALMNRKMAPEIETLFLMPKEEFSYISSSTVREISTLGGDVSGLAPPATVQALKKKFPSPPGDDAGAATPTKPTGQNP